MNEEILKNWQSALREVARPEKVKILQSFFKTGPGEYAEGDIMIGVSVPDNRKISREFHDAPTEVIATMLKSEIHEFRLAALLALVRAYQKAKNNPDRREGIIKLYIANVARCNNWDLVDLSAPYLLGSELAAGRHNDDLAALSDAPLLWARRMAVVSTLHLVMKHGLTGEAIHQCRRHIADPEPLMHKAVGWVMREVGKKDLTALLAFLDENIATISATTISYATEKLPTSERRDWQQRRRNRL